MPDTVMKPGVAVLVGDTFFALPARFDAPHSLSRRIARCAYVREEDLEVRIFRSFGNLALLGEACHCVVVHLDPYTFPELSQARLRGANDGVLVVVDARDLGASICAFAMDSGSPSISHCAAAAHIPSFEGRRLRLITVDRCAPCAERDFSCLHLQLTYATDEEPFMQVLGPYLDETDPPTAVPWIARPSEEPASHSSDENSSLRQEDSSDGDDARFLKFLVLAVSHAPRPVEVVLQMPSDLQSALNAVEFGLDDEFYALFPLVVSVLQQPARSWGLVLALPIWADQEPIAVLDLRAVDGRLFAAQLTLELTRASLLQAADLTPDSTVDIYPFARDRPLGAQEVLALQSHGLITFYYNAAPPSGPSTLEELLASPDRWDITAELPTGLPWQRAEQVCVVLPDTLSRALLFLLGEDPFTMKICLKPLGFPSTG